MGTIARCVKKYLIPNIALTTMLIISCFTLYHIDQLSLKKGGGDGKMDDKIPNIALTTMLIMARPEGGGIL